MSLCSKRNKSYKISTQPFTRAWANIWNSSRICSMYMRIHVAWFHFQRKTVFRMQQISFFHANTLTFDAEIYFFLKKGHLVWSKKMVLNSWKKYFSSLVSMKIINYYFLQNHKLHFTYNYVKLIYYIVIINFTFFKIYFIENYIFRIKRIYNTSGRSSTCVERNYFWILTWA